MGLPAHPLIVHAVVVLLPLAAMGVFVLALVPRSRSAYGPLVLIVTTVAVAMVPLATQSGEGLQESVRETAAVAKHAEIGSTAPFFAAPLLVMAAALWWLGWRAKRGTPVGKGFALAITIASVVISIAVGIQIARIGHSGAESVWGNVGTSSGSDGG